VGGGRGMRGVGWRWERDRSWWGRIGTGGIREHPVT